MNELQCPTHRNCYRLMKACHHATAGDLRDCLACWKAHRKVDPENVCGWGGP